MSEKIRIVSDLHIGHRASVIEDMTVISSLAEGVDRLICNGDTLELKYGDVDSLRYDAQKQKQQFDELISSLGVIADLITGNHDPAISDKHFLSICDDQVFITHGDTLFKEIAPWSSNIKNLREVAKDIDEEQTGTIDDLNVYMAQFKQVSIEAHKRDGNYNPTLLGKLGILAHQAWPPTTPFKIINCWRQVPDRAVSLTARFGMKPKFIILGHTHNPGVWQRGDQTVINLGAYFPWPGASCIDIADGELTLRKIRKSRNKIRIGQALARFPIEARETHCVSQICT